MKVLVVTEIRLYRDGVAEALRRLDDVELAVTAATGVAAVLTAQPAGTFHARRRTYRLQRKPRTALAVLNLLTTCDDEVVR